MKGVASDLAGCLKWKEAAYLMFEDGADTVRRATAVVTLGSDVDLLQERYQNTGRMLESYMLESIGGELMACWRHGYGRIPGIRWRRIIFSVMTKHIRCLRCRRS